MGHARQERVVAGPKDHAASTRAATARSLASAIVGHARGLGARLIVLKEFPDQYRDALSCFVRGGFTRIPSMPHTRLNIAYADFDDYMQSALNSATRRKLRKKFNATASGVPIAPARSVSSLPRPMPMLSDQSQPEHKQHGLVSHFAKLGG
jgi:predicted N-acyltransferase